MADKKYKTIAIIPARGGSKRIPNKNLKEFLGIPILQMILKKTKECMIFDEIMVSTDSEQIKKLSLDNGANVPFMRSSKNADDLAPLQNVIFEVLEFYQSQNISFEYFCCILPTAALLKKQNLQKAYDLLDQNNDLDGIMPVCEYSNPILRSYTIENNLLKINSPENYLKRSQDLPPAYYDAGQFYFYRTKSFLKQKTFMTKNTYPLFLKEIESQDIDTIDDWNLAEMKHKINFKDYE